MRNIIVEPYNESWAQNFADISAELSAALGDKALRIEHVGSTSVCGLSAKPIIDIDIVISDDAELDDIIAALSTIGYHHKGDRGIPGREAFDYEGKEHLRQHHLYVCRESASELRRHISFRDYLRTHPDAVREYSRIKEEGAELYPHDIDRYIEHKSPFIESIYRELQI